ncbi:MAG: hypothetical protein IJW76_08785 [Clostridia bacterium]|nr:hypothetical protein [Clostridia bacterium]
MNLNIFKNFKKTDEQMFMDTESREAEIARLFREAASAKTQVEEYWQKMRAYYSGTHETARKTGAFLASVNVPWKPAQIADGYMHVESQVVPKMPDFEFAPRSAEDGEAAKAREKIVRYIAESNEMEAKNAMNERRLGVLGSAVWKLSAYIDGRGMPEIAIDNPSPRNIYPDPSAASVEDCEFIGYTYRMSKMRARRVFAADFARMGTTLDGLIEEARKDKKKRETLDIDIFDERCPTVDVLEWWFRQGEDGVYINADGSATAYSRGDIALSILIGGKEVRYVPKFWSNTVGGNFPFVIYGRVPNDGSIWGKSELEEIIPLIDAADRQLAFAQLNAAFFANDVLVYEENAFAPDSLPDNRPGAVWKLRPGMIDKVSRLGGLTADSEAHYEIVERYRKIIKETLGNYDYMQGDFSTKVTTATGLAILSDLAAARIGAKNVCKKEGFRELYRLCDLFALEFFTKEKTELVLGSDANGKTSAEYFAEYGYIPEIDVRIHIGEGAENSRSFTISALSELASMEITAENYPIVRSYISALDLPNKAELTEELDKKYKTDTGE